MIAKQKSPVVTLLATMAHERICSERQRHIIQNLSELKRSVEGLYRRFWSVAVGVIALLISACGGLIYLILTRVSQ